MKLFFSPASPYVRKVHVLLRELGRIEEVDLHEVTTTAFDTDQGLIASNPLGKIPALERPDGITLYDSRVICAYLNDRFEGGFYPQGNRRWETLALEATGDGMMDCAVSMAYEARLRPENERSPQWIEAQWTKISRTLGALESRWMSHLRGPVDMGQISVACALSYIDFRHEARKWRDGHQALAEWHAQFESRPSMQGSQPPSA